MKLSYLFTFAVLLFCLNLDAQRSKKKKSSQDNPREERKIAICAEQGIKSITGLGLVGSYYVKPKFAIDAGLGLGFQGIKGGVRGRYLFLDKRFSPYAGAGLHLSPTSVDDVLITSSDPNSTTDYFIDIEGSTYGQILFGLEYMSFKGFVIGANLGYAINFNAPVWSSDFPVDDTTTAVLNILYGNGISTGFNIGYAF